MKFKQPPIAIALALVLLVLFCILLNSELGQVPFLFWKISISRALILLSALIFGIFIGVIYASYANESRGVSKSDQVDSGTIVDRNEISVENMQSSRFEARQSAEYDIYKSGIDKINIAHNNELHITKTDLKAAKKYITSLKEEIGRLHEEIETKELIERIIHHDLRGAVSASISLPEAVLDDANLDDGQKLIMTLIRDSGKKMLEILDSSLMLYRIEEGTYKKEFTTVNIRKIISMVVERIRETLLISEQEVLIKCIYHENNQKNDVFSVLGDEFLLFSAFMNLITNASEASPPGKNITVTLSQDNQCNIAIRNYGEVPKAIRHSFFNKMITSGKKFGTGLGTYSAMLMIQTQNGNIELDSSEPGVTTIHVSLPRPTA